MIYNPFDIDNIECYINPREIVKKIFDVLHKVKSDIKYLKNDDALFRVDIKYIKNALSTFIPKSDIVDETGESLTKLMSQKSTSDALNNKQNKLTAGENINIENDIISATGGNSGHNYSTEEQVIGTWIDGKPIYEKTFTFNTPLDLYSTITEWAAVPSFPNLTSLNIDRYIDGFIYLNNVTAKSVLTKVVNNTMYARYTNLNISRDEALCDTFTIQYTKTTDTI